MNIHILPSNIANMIAAGEVVQRPASVVKELVENAVDAGATNISVVILDSGRTLIQVIDNGCGMSPDEAVLCFQRHATSKIATAADLEDIRTYGFRGEALPSIAAVAEVTLKTRRPCDETAAVVTITDATADSPGKQDISTAAAPVGTSIAVSNLFYNTPARRKFLKSDAVEMKAIVAEFQRVALTRTDISFTLLSNGKPLCRLSPASGVKFRISDLFGQSAAAELLPLEVETSVASISGFIAPPQAARKNAVNQFFFVGGRYFRSAYLHKAVMKAYENLVPQGYMPSYFIYLTVNPGAVDINVHPTKTEVKFEDDNVLFDVLNAAVREALGRSVCDDVIDFDSATVPNIRNVGYSFEEYRGIAEPSTVKDSGFNPFEGDGFPNQKEWEPSHRDSYDNLFEGLSSEGRAGTLSENSGPCKTVCPEGPLPIVAGRFILSRSKSGVMLIDMVRAMQRILYERFLAALSKEEPVGQTTLFPLEVEVGAENIQLLVNNADMLGHLGFDISPIGVATISVNSLPQGLSDDKMSVSALIYEVVTALGDEKVSIAGAMYASLAEKLAKSSSRSVILPSDGLGARELCDSLFDCETPQVTSDGRRILTVLKVEDLESFLK